jgi:hypothetical protein
MYAVAKTVRGGTALDDPARITSLEFTAQLNALVEQGVTVYRLAKVLGVGHSTVYARLARHGYRNPSPSQAHSAYKGRTVRRQRGERS